MASGSDINSYIWDNKNSENRNEYTVRPINDETVYSLEGKDEFGCTNRDEITVVVTPTPTFEIIGENAVCINDEITLVGSDKKLEYSWKNKNGDEISSSTSATITITQDTTLYITGTAKNSNGTICSSTIEYVIRKKERPTINANYSNAICYGSSATINVFGSSDNYEWYKNGKLISTENSYEEVITEPQKYLVKGYMNGCDDSISIDIAVKEIPAIEITGANEICFNDSVVLNATAGLNSYQWKNLTTSSFLSSTSEEIKIAPKVDSKIEVIVSNAEGCENRDSFDVIVNSLPSFTISANENSVCENSEVELTTSNDKLTYKWENETEFSSNLNKIFAMGSFPMADTFKVTAMTDKGCIKSDSIRITTKARPQLNIVFTDSICFGKQATMTGHNNTAKYKWYDVTNGVENLLSESSSYTTDALTENRLFKSIATSNGCESDTTFEVAIRELPEVKIENSPIITICDISSRIEIKKSRTSNAFPFAIAQATSKGSSVSLYSSTNSLLSAKYSKPASLNNSFRLGEWLAKISSFIVVFYLTTSLLFSFSTLSESSLVTFSTLSSFLTKKGIFKIRYKIIIATPSATKTIACTFDGLKLTASLPPL